MSRPSHAIVVAASAGGLDPLERLVAALPPDLTASVFIVQHTGPTGPGYLAAILNRTSLVPCAYATDGEPMRAGRVYIAPADRHLQMVEDRLQTTSGPRENNVRPAADVLFRSAAATFGAQTIGVVVSGMLDDGAEGLAAIVAAGGRAVVQDPAEALHRSMPDSALARVQVHACVGASQLAGAVLALMNELGSTAADPTPEDGEGIRDERSTDPFTCPDCGGPITVSEATAGLRRFRCLVGHKYSEASYLHALEEVRERTLWSAHRLLRQHAILQGLRAARARRQGDDVLATQLDELAGRARGEAVTIGEMIGAADQLATLTQPQRMLAEGRLRSRKDGSD